MIVRDNTTDGIVFVHHIGFSSLSRPGYRRTSDAPRLASGRVCQQRDACPGEPLVHRQECDRQGEGSRKEIVKVV